MLHNVVWLFSYKNASDISLKNYCNNLNYILFASFGKVSQFCSVWMCRETLKYLINIYLESGVTTSQGWQKTSSAVNTIKKNKRSSRFWVLTRQRNKQRLIFYMCIPWPTILTDLISQIIHLTKKFVPEIFISKVLCDNTP